MAERQRRAGLHRWLRARCVVGVLACVLPLALPAAPDARAQEAASAVAGLSEHLVAGAFEQRSFSAGGLPPWIETVGAAGNVAPPVNPEDRRATSLRTVAHGSADTTLSLSTGMSETLQTVLDSPERPGIGERRRSAAGAGGALDLLDGRLRFDGELAGTRLHDSATDAADSDGQFGAAGRLGAAVMLLDGDGLSLGVRGFHRHAEPGYAGLGALAPGWAETGAGMRFAAGPLAFGLEGSARHNNLDRDPEGLTQRERALRPSLAVSLDRLRQASSVPGRSLIPSAVRFGHTASWMTATPEAERTLDLADPTQRRGKSDMLGLDWRWDGALTTLSATLDRATSRLTGMENADSDGRSLSLRHAIAGSDLAASLALAMRRTGGWDNGGRNEVETVGLAAAVAARGFVFGDMVASVAIDRGRSAALDAATTEIGITWRAKAAFDLATLLPQPSEDGSLSFALAVNGTDPQPLENRPDAVELVLGLAGRMRF